MKPKVSLVVGHEEKSPGAWGVLPLGQYEYFYNKDFAMRLVTTLRPSFEAVAFFRDGLGICKTYDAIDKWDPDFNLELHFNAAVDPKAQGTEVLCVPWQKDYAGMIQDGLCRALAREGHTDRGIKVLTDPSERGYESVIRLRCHSALIEPFFGSSESDVTLALSRQKEMCREIHDALLELWTLQSE